LPNTQIRDYMATLIEREWEVNLVACIQILNLRRVYENNQSTMTVLPLSHFPVRPRDSLVLPRPFLGSRSGSLAGIVDREIYIGFIVRFVDRHRAL
jgi:hypothetical protein